MRITFIGMSGVGKTYLAKQLEKYGYTRYSVDDFIENKLKEELKKYGYKGLADVSKWMGQPYEPHYASRSRRYLDLERKSVEEIIRIMKRSGEKNIVVDTTGSIIYLDENILHQLSIMTKIIYFETPADVKEQMFKSYLLDPKPVIWGNLFKKKDNESEKDSLHRCYPILLSGRQKKYQQYAQSSISMHKLRSPNFNVETLLVS